MVAFGDLRRRGSLRGRLSGGGHGPLGGYRASGSTISRATCRPASAAPSRFAPDSTTLDGRRGDRHHRVRLHAREARPSRRPSRGRATRPSTRTRPSSSSWTLPPRPRPSSGTPDSRWTRLPDRIGLRILTGEPREAILKARYGQRPRPDGVLVVQARQRFPDEGSRHAALGQGRRLARAASHRRGSGARASRCADPSR